MQSKTPKFDALIDEVLKDLVPHTRTCRWKGEHKHCEGEFNIEEGDIGFLKTFRVPPPNFCPTCRRMRRFVHMGLLRLFKRPCDAPGHTESMISVFSEGCPFPVFDYKYFTGGEFDPYSYGVLYKEGEDPMGVLSTMRKSFPVPSFLNRDPASINSDYSNGGRDTKNVYYAGGCFSVENAWYCSLVNKSKDIMDSRAIHNSDHIYSSAFVDNSYKSSFLYFSKDCSESMFLFDCRNSTNCFGCIGLRNAKYCVWNEQLSKEAYENFMQAVHPLTRDKIKQYDKSFWALVKQTPVNASMNTAVNGVSGVLLENSKDLINVTDSERSEHIRHSDGCIAHKDSMDVTFSGGSSLLYSATNIGSLSNNVKFSVAGKFCTDSEFIFNCRNVSNSFMCFGLQNKSYCVLNKQYTSEEYFALVDTIKTDMMQRREYGDGLGFEFSAQAYNFSHAQVSFPLTDEEIIKFGGYIAPEPDTNAGTTVVLSGRDIPETIEGTKDDIINFAIKCEVTGRPFRITESELQFYRAMQLPIPWVHPSLRIQNHFTMVPLGISYEADCAKCNQSISSLFDPKQGYTLYCEKCYQQEVY